MTTLPAAVDLRRPLPRHRHRRNFPPSPWPLLNSTAACPPPQTRLNTEIAALDSKERHKLSVNRFDFRCGVTVGLKPNVK